MRNTPTTGVPKLSKTLERHGIQTAPPQNRVHASPNPRLLGDQEASCHLRRHPRSRLPPTDGNLRPQSVNPLGPLKLLNLKDRVSKPVQKQRLSICLECEHAVIGLCDICYCPLAAKSWVASEKCPINKWESVELS